MVNAEDDDDDAIVVFSGLISPVSECEGAGDSSAHSTSVMCSTSVGKSIGRFWMEVDVSFFQWREVVYSASVMAGGSCGSWSDD